MGQVDGGYQAPGGNLATEIPANVEQIQARGMSY